MVRADCFFGLFGGFEISRRSRSEFAGGFLPKCVRTNSRILHYSCGFLPRTETKFLVWGNSRPRHNQCGFLPHGIAGRFPRPYEALLCSSVALCEGEAKQATSPTNLFVSISMEISDLRELSNLLGNNLSQSGVYLEALDGVRKNSQGKTWLIGSGVYKTLLNALYGCAYSIKDWDFITEMITAPIKLGDGWIATETKHGNPKLKKGDFVIDLIALDNIHSIKERNIEPNINNYLSGTPLTIQSIAFDVNRNELLGEVGIQSILTKTVGVNNKAEYDYAAGIYGDLYSTKRYADRLGFKKYSHSI